MVSLRTRVASRIFPLDHPDRPDAMICCFFSSFNTFAMLREATYPPAVVNVLDISSESMAAFQVFLYGRFWVFTEVIGLLWWFLFRSPLRAGCTFLMRSALLCCERIVPRPDVVRPFLQRAFVPHAFISASIRVRCAWICAIPVASFRERSRPLRWM